MPDPTSPLIKSELGDRETVRYDIAPETLRELAQLLCQYFTVHLEANKSSLAKKTGLSLNEYQALGFLQEFQGISIRQLAQLLNLSNGGTQALLKRLEAANYIWRTPSPTDKRMVKFYPNPMRYAEIYTEHTQLAMLHNAVENDPTQMLAIYDFLLNQIIKMRENSLKWLQDHEQ